MRLIYCIHVLEFDYDANPKLTAEQQIDVKKAFGDETTPTKKSGSITAKNKTVHKLEEYNAANRINNDSWCTNMAPMY